MSFASSIAVITIALSGILLMLGWKEAALRLFFVAVLIAFFAPYVERLFDLGSH